MFNVLNEYTEKLYPDIEELREKNDERIKKEKEEQEKLRLQAKALAMEKAGETEETKNTKEIKESDLEEKKEEKPEIESAQTNQKSMNQLIKEEIAGLKKEEKFYVFDLQTRSMIFIKISKPYRDIIDVVKLGTAILKDIHENKMTLTRFCYKFIPITFV